jgi:hypothetical protein
MVRLQELKYTQDQSLAWLKPPKKFVTDSHPEQPVQPSADATRRPVLQEKEESMEIEPPVDPVLLSLEKLQESVPPPRKARFASSLQDMTEMTGLITSHMCAPNIPSVAEAEVRKEIRATKGLLLNR